MESKSGYRIIVIGPTGAGKSQFCNFAQKDFSNSINKVSSSLNSCTAECQSNFFTRENTNYEFIDTPGSSDSNIDDIETLKKLIIYIREKKSIDYILLLLKFGDRVTKKTREYIEILGKIFTPAEFYNHVGVIFTHFPINPTKKQEKIKINYIEKINILLKDIFNIEHDIPLPEVNVYFIDTEIDEENNTYEDKYQYTIDIMMKQIKLDVHNNGSIDTSNFDFTGESVKSRLQIQKEKIEELTNLLKLYELDKKKKEEEEKILKKEINEIKNNEKKRRENEIKLKKIEESLRQERIRLNEINEKNRKIYEENLKKKRLIDEEAEKKGIKIEKLNKIINNSKKAAIGAVLGGIFAGLLFLGAWACFVADPTKISFIVLTDLALNNIGAAMIWTSGISAIGSVTTLLGSGITAAGAKIQKDNLKK